MASFDEAVKIVCGKHNLRELNTYQREALVQFVEKRRDVFVNLPTGSGKSMIYLALPLLFDSMYTDISGHVVVVVSPLVSLMKDQVSSLRGLGISAVSLSDIKDEEIKDIEKGNFSVVYGTPEAWLKCERWRKLLSSSIYNSKLCGIAVDEAHVIKQWGTSNNTNKAAFRESYSMLHELRAVAPSVKMIAVTATSTKHTRETIIDSLQMENPYIIYESPSKPNIAYSVCYMPKDESVDTYFQWLGKELKELGIHTTRTIIYCQTIKQCTIIYSTIKGMLGNKLFTGDLNDRRHVLMEMLHSCTPESNKNLVLEAFKDKDSEIRVLVATIAFGMGIDCKGVHRTIHFGPSKNIESYIQESGRAGRDGEQSSSFVLYQGLMLNHVNKDIKEYLRTNCCRRKHLLSSFDLASEVNNVSPKHLCCDICAKQCPCKSPGCGILTKFPYDPEQATSRSVSERSRAITDEQLDMILTSLYSYHKSLLKQLVQTSTSNVKKSNMKFLIGFSELQIDQVKKNCDKLFTIDDVLHYVEIWDIKHAHNILRMVSQTFGDVSHEYATNNIQLEQEESLEDNDDFDDWNYILEDDALFDLAMENLSASLLDVSMDDTLNCPNNADLPSSALDALELMTLNTSYID